MASIINASTTSTSGLVQTADASGVLQLQSNGAPGLTIESNAAVTVNTNLSTPNGRVEPLVLGTAQTASGSSVDFTDIPSWVKRITVSVNSVSYAAAGSGVVRIGSGSLVTTGYLWTQQSIFNGTATIVGTENPSGGFANFTTNAAAAVAFGYTVLTLVNPATNTWMSQGMASRPSDNIVQTWVGYVSLSGVLDRVSLVATSSTFDAGTVNIIYE